MTRTWSALNSNVKDQFIVRCYGWFRLIALLAMQWFSYFSHPGIFIWLLYVCMCQIRCQRHGQKVLPIIFCAVLLPMPFIRVQPGGTSYFCLNLLCYLGCINASEHFIYTFGVVLCEGPEIRNRQFLLFEWPVRLFCLVSLLLSVNHQARIVAAWNSEIYC